MNNFINACLSGTQRTLPALPFVVATTFAASTSFGFVASRFVSNFPVVKVAIGITAIAAIELAVKEMITEGSINSILETQRKIIAFGSSLIENSRIGNSEIVKFVSENPLPSVALGFMVIAATVSVIALARFCIHQYKIAAEETKKAKEEEEKAQLLIETKIKEIVDTQEDSVILRGNITSILENKRITPEQNEIIREKLAKLIEAHTTTIYNLCNATKFSEKTSKSIMKMFESDSVATEEEKTKLVDKLYALIRGNQTFSEELKTAGEFLLKNEYLNEERTRFLKTHIENLTLSNSQSFY